MRVYLSELSIGPSLGRDDPPLERLPSTARDRGFDGIELTDRRVAAADPATLDRLRLDLRASDCGFVLDACCDLSAADPSARRDEVAHVVAMMRLAASLGAEAVRVWLGGQGVSVHKLLGRGRRRRTRETGPPRGSRSVLSALASSRAVGRLSHRIRTLLPAPRGDVDQPLARAVDSLRTLLPEARRLDLRLAVENHWGISSRPEVVMRAVQAVGSDRVGTCPDLANVPRDVDRYRALEILAPRAVLVHARSERFLAGGDERDIDYARCADILRRSGFGGWFSVEYTGPGDGFEGARRTRDLLRRTW